MQPGAREGRQTLPAHLDKLCKQGRIRLETAKESAEDIEKLKRYLS